MDGYFQIIVEIKLYANITLFVRDDSFEVRGIRIRIVVAK